MSRKISNLLFARLFNSSLSLTISNNSIFFEELSAFSLFMLPFSIVLAQLLSYIFLWYKKELLKNHYSITDKRYTDSEGFILGLQNQYLENAPKITRYKTDKHFLSIAPNRSGKGTGLIIPNLLDNPETSVFVIDPKGENALVSARWRKSQGHEIVIFNPYGIYAEKFGERGFHQFQTFNPLANLDPKSSRFVGDVDNLAEALIYETGGDSHWTEAAQGLVGLLIMYLVTEPTETPTLRRLRELLAGGIGEGSPLKEALLFCEKNELGIVCENAGRFLSDNEEVRSVISTAETQTRILRNHALCQTLEGKTFDFEEMKNKKISVYLVLPSDYLITQARFLRLLLMSAMTQFMRSESGNYRVLMILDEFANLGRLPLIEQGFGLIAGYGITLWPFVQNLSQLQKLYKDNWEVFIANSAAITVSNVNDITTAKYFSERSGSKKIIKEVKSKSGSSRLGIINGFSKNWSITQQEHEENNLRTSDLYDNDNSQLFIFFEGKSVPLIAQKAYYGDFDGRFPNLPPLKTRADPNPMHTGAAIKSI
jgi:type IV secretion system protein VirD4